MLEGVRQNAVLVVTLLGLTLLSMWLSGAHRHRPLTHDGHVHAPSLHGHYHHVQSEAHDRVVIPSDVPTASTPDAGIHAEQHSDIKLTVLKPSAGKPLADLLLLALLACGMFLLRRPAGRATLPLPDPPPRWHSGFSLRPPLRGPPLLAS